MNGLRDQLPPHTVPAPMHFDTFTCGENAWSVCTGRVFLVKAACKRMVQREHASALATVTGVVTCRDCVAALFDTFFGDTKPWWSRE